VQLPPLFRAPTWHFRCVASSLLGPHQTGARVTTLNLTPPHPPMTDPMNPLTLLETIAPAGDFRAVWRAPSRAHTRASWLSRPTLVSQPITSLPEAKPREQTRSPGAAAAAAVCVILAMSGGPPLLVSLNPGLAVDNDDGGGKGEGGNLLFRPIRRRWGGNETMAMEEGGRRVRGSS